MKTEFIQQQDVERSEDMYARYVELRTAAGVRDADVAKATGIHQSSFTDWKKGKSEPKLEKLIKIANYFGVSILEFTNALELEEGEQRCLSVH